MNRVIQPAAIRKTLLLEAPAPHAFEGKSGFARAFAKVDLDRNQY